MAKTEKTLLNFQLEVELRDKGKALAEKRGISLAGLLRQLLIKELESEEKK
ncbi:hypothetical protein [Rufibacter quisquiliarum]|uniref:Ribbon-helix-helix protein, copG family n=1 Tax=Rufibacter quisquiliarum TaxID=1549639 RepID=A0A839GQJ1_9BACT|nr:hypothetical protein [Rufibacter quisquiliarum]MBA9076101.1 hypothetical protein [Rufibacter quisquiliarum]